MSSLTDQLNVFDSAKIEWKYEGLTVYFARLTVKNGHFMFKCLFDCLLECELHALFLNVIVFTLNNLFYICLTLKSFTDMRKCFALMICLLIWINISVLAQQDNLSSGLYFSSHEVNQDKRTSLLLTPQKPLTFSKKFRISFDASFRQGDGYYGHICRIIGNENTNIDLLSNTGSENANFWLVYKDQILFSYTLKEIPESEFGKLISINIDFDLSGNTLTTSFNGVRKSKKVSELSHLKTFDIVYGVCSNPKFQSTDVVPMTLYDVKITDHKGKMHRNWKLTKHGVNEVYDEVHGHVAKVRNGIWLIDRHVKWTKNISTTIPDLVGLAKNESAGLIYLIGKTMLYVYSVQNHNMDTIQYTSGCPFDNYYNYFIYDSTVNKIISYDFSENYLNEFDFDSRSWKQSSFEYKEPDLAHHNVVISPHNGELYTFGGYGHYKYKSTIMNFNREDNAWGSLDMSNQIYPRYLSAAGLDHNKNWLIFGGYGSKSGRQEVLPEFYFDLFSYDFKTSKITKLQQYKVPEIPFVPCEGLVENRASRSFYTMVYNTSNFSTSLRLAEFNIDEPEYTIYPDAVPYNFSDTESWCIFFLHKKSKNLVTVTAHKNEVAVYTLAYPALTTSEVEQKSSRVDGWLIWLLCGVVGLGMLVFFLVLPRKRKRTDYNILNEVFISDRVEGVNLNINKHISKSSIYFLGGFQVFDKEGNDISSAFTPTLKLLFIIILLSTVKNGRGISTNKLNETLWYDKSNDSARNNRNVSISKLRTILEKVGAIDVDQESSYWRVNMEDVYSDYIELTNLCERFGKHNSSLNETEIQHFVQIAYRGELLPEFQIDWLDEFKADFSNMILDTLFDFTKLAELKNNLHLLYLIAECILKFDVINEDAITLKCLTLYKLRKKGLAKTAYDSFVRDYQNLLGTDYPVSLNDIINEMG